MTRINFPNRESAPPPAKPKRLSRQKRKRMNEDAEYNAMRDIFLEQNKICDWCGIKQSEELHHILRGKDRRVGLLNPRTWLVLCRDCHAGPLASMRWELQVCIKQNAVLRTIERLRK